MKVVRQSPAIFPHRARPTSITGDDSFAPSLALVALGPDRFECSLLKPVDAAARMANTLAQPNLNRGAALPTKN